MGRELYLINKDKFQEVLKKQTTYIVTNLPQNLTNADFRKHLESFGEVVVSELYYTKAQNQMVVDYGKVSFMTEEAGQKFLQENKTQKLEGHELEIRDFNLKEMSKMKGFNLIVTNFPPVWGREEIKAFLQDRLPELKEENMNISQSKKQNYTAKLSLGSLVESKQTIEKLNGESVYDQGQEYKISCTKFLNKKNLVILKKTE